jgi:hypothetical protein
MKTNSSTHARLICRVARWWCAVTESEAMSSGHVASCAECRAYFALGAELEAELRHEATAARAEAPVGLEHGIMAAVAEDERMAPAPTTAMAPRFSVATLAFAGTAAAAFAIIFGVARWSQERERGATEKLETARELAGLATAAEQFSDEWLNTKLPAAGTAALDNPLRQELDSLNADAHSALDFLALNFLPSTGPEAKRGAGKGQG